MKIVEEVESSVTNWEKQQKQFEGIMESQLERLNSMTREMSQQRKEVERLREENFSLREAMKELERQHEEAHQRYSRKLMTMSNYHEESQMRRVQEARQKELLGIVSGITQRKKQIEQNNEQIASLEKSNAFQKEQKDHLTDELTNFLKTILKSDTL